jgi:hypothetical protein
MKEEKQLNPFQEFFAELSIVHKKLDALAERFESNSQSKSQQQLIAELPDNLQTKHLKKLFGKSHVTYWTWCKKGLLRPQIIRGQKYYAKADVLALLHQKQGKVC